MKICCKTKQNDPKNYVVLDLMKIIFKWNEKNWACQCVMHIRHIWIFSIKYWIFEYKYWNFQQWNYLDIRKIYVEYMNIWLLNTNEAFSTLWRFISSTFVQIIVPRHSKTCIKVWNNVCLSYLVYKCLNIRKSSIFKFLFEQKCTENYIRISIRTKADNMNIHF